MFNSKFLIIAAALMGFSVGAVNAAELVVIGDGPAAKSKGGKDTARFDFYTDGTVAAFQFGVKLPAGATKVNLGNCLAGLPKSHQGVCRLNPAGDMLAVVVYSTQNEPLSSGTLRLGSISYQRSAAKAGSGGVEIQAAMASNSDGTQESVQLTLAE